MVVVTQVLAFIEQGGTVIWAVFAACLIMWATIVERLWFFKRVYPGLAKTIEADWQRRSDRRSWLALKMREATVSEVSMLLHTRLALIQTLIALCPMLGLLGTVTGMVGVFEVIAASGNSDAQSIAQGIYRATIPTMSGLVVALSGYYFAARLRQLADKLTHQLADRLVLA